MKLSISGVIWNKDGRAGANEALAARLAERELARMAEARALLEPVESEAA
jgi:hypothetical protein